MVARRKKSSRGQLTLELQQLMDAVTKTGRTPTQVLKRRGRHTTVAERRRQALVRLCGRKDELEKHRGSYVVPDANGTVIAWGFTEDLARAAGAAHLGCRLKSVLVVPLAVCDENAEELALDLLREFSTL